MRILGATALVLLLAAGVGQAEPLQTQVVDARTGQPIEGAVVLGLWLRDGGPPVQAEGETDAQGRFSLDRPAPVASPGGEFVIVYKDGYVVWNNVEVFQPTEQPPWYQPRQDTRIPARILLEPFPANGNHARHLWYIDSATGASQRGWGQIPKFERAIQRERDEALKKATP